MLGTGDHDPKDKGKNASELDQSDVETTDELATLIVNKQHIQTQLILC